MAQSELVLKGKSTWMFIFTLITYVLRILLNNNVSERQNRDKWPFRPGVTETRLWCLESCSPHRSSQRELPCLVIADKQADVSFSVLQAFFFFKAAGYIIFWMALHRVLYSIPHTHPAYANPISAHHKAVVFASNRQACIIHKKPAVQYISSAWETCFLLGHRCVWVSLFATCDADEIQQVTEWRVQVSGHVVGGWTPVTLILTLLIQPVHTLSTNPKVTLALLIGFSRLSVSTPLGRVLPVTPVISILPVRDV